MVELIIIYQYAYLTKKTIKNLKNTYHLQKNMELKNNHNKINLKLKFIVKNIFGCVFIFNIYGYIFAEWNISVVDSEGRLGGHTSIAIDSNDYPHISYSGGGIESGGRGGLIFAKWTGTCWAIESIDSPDTHVAYTSVALDSNGYPNISYYGGLLMQTKYTKYAKWDGTKWIIKIIDTEGTHTSLVLDNNGNPCVSYCHANWLKYARWTGTTWDIQNVDVVIPGGVLFSSLVLDSSARPHISYYDFNAGNLKYARWTGSSWSIEIVDSIGDVGWALSLALDSAGYPHISYLDMTNLDLKYARWTGSNWNVQTVDSEGIVGDYTAIFIDTDDNPHISYWGNDTLKYAKWDGAIWSIQTVDSSPKVCHYTDIVLDSYNNPHISYQDQTNYDIKYARWVTPVPINQPPSPPGLVSPSDGSWTNAQPTLVWNVPADADGDDLHFKVELSSVSDFSAKDVFESNVSTKGFSPVPPVAQGIGQMSYTIQPETFLYDSTTYYWKVAAFDGTVYGGYSGTRSFIVDNKAPSYTISATPDPVTFATDVTITVVASEPLTSIRTFVRQNGQASPTEITMSSTDNITWTGTYTAINNYDGIATIDITGSDNFYTSKSTGSFNVSIGPAGRNLIISDVSDTPDPFDPDIESTNISFNLELRPITVTNSTTTIKIVSSTDELYSTFVLYHSASGLYNVSQLWDGKDATGNYVPDGKYFYVINSTATRTAGVNVSYVTAIEKRGEITVLRQAEFDYASSQISNPENAKITITPNPDGKTASTFGILQGSVGSIYDIQPTSTTFEPSAMLTLFYDEAQLNGIDETTLDIFRYNPDTGNWTALGASVDTVNNKLAVAIDKISIYTIATKNAVFIPTPVAGIDFTKPTFTVYLTIDPEKTDDMRVTALSSEKLLSANAEIIPHGNSPKKAHLSVPLQATAENLWTGKFTKQTGFGDVEKIIISGWDLAGNFGISDGSYTKNIVSSEGGVIKDPITKVEITIAANSLNEATVFSVKKIENRTTLKCGLQTISSYEFKSDKKFDKPVKIKIPYTAEDVNGLNENNLKIAYLNETTNDYEPLESEVDTDAKTVSADVEHFSIYAIVYQQPQMTPEPDTTFTKGEIYAYPNPAKQGVFPKIHIEVGLADKLQINLYNIAGEIVHSVELYEPPSVINDKYVYEYAWNVSDIASGIYIYTIKAKKSGEHDIKAQGKVAIIR
ncbi:MAG: hypothetical protein AB1349_10250 [Elusimicrobiota bacterium]